jgi:hypothetical protein
MSNHAREGIEQLRSALAAKEQEIADLKLKEQVLYDLHEALGITWGDDPYARLAALTTARDEALAIVIRHRDRNSEMFNASKDLTDKTMLLAATGACEQIRIEIEAAARLRVTRQRIDEDDTKDDQARIGQAEKAPAPQHAATNEKVSSDV